MTPLYLEATRPWRPNRLPHSLESSLRWREYFAIFTKMRIMCILRASERERFQTKEFETSCPSNARAFS